ncbi:hypothetical protein CFN78_21985 [Amycolatopsis antarctica]|uniref:Uncharacterized protein n=1 Tax=Amycolatopsis antarctica TaxID=1854586 RepID=A0A263D1B5_9PSEU|nr:hypothetical protein [Amycolatopsis antarctica]OZM71135.1 hypothetical protein CFN78_21985 [Amycolatopsis antarctica]
MNAIDPAEPRPACPQCCGSGFADAWEQYRADWGGMVTVRLTCTGCDGSGLQPPAGGTPGP